MAVAVVVAVIFMPCGSASAFVARWYNDNEASFQGSGCGSKSTVRIYVPGNAFDVTVDNQFVGTTYRDIGTGEPVARVTSISRQGTHVRFTATGSDDVCANPDSYAGIGWQTNDEYFRVDFRTRVHVFVSVCGNRPRYRPRSIIIACGDGNFYVSAIHWRYWGDARAYGVGVGHENDCVPYCAAGHFHSYPHVVVRLGKRRYCGGPSEYLFSKLTYRFAGAKPPGVRSRGSGWAPCPIS